MAEPDAPKSVEEDPWASATFEGSELETLRRSAQLTFAQKLAWLEEMQEIVLHFQAQRRKEGLKTVNSDGALEE